MDHVIDLIYDRECPNLGAARERLGCALRDLGLAERWREWDLGDSQAPAEFRRYGSPTILINGRDVAGSEPQVEGATCRLYRDDLGRPAGAPSVEAIRLALSSPDG